MVRDGTEGTSSGDGLKQLYAQYNNYYEAFRAYNSGSVDQKNLMTQLALLPLMFNPLPTGSWVTSGLACKEFLDFHHSVGTGETVWVACG